MTTGFDSTDFNSLTGPLLVSAHNAMVSTARAMGQQPAFVREVSRFSDKESAVRRCEALRSHLRAVLSSEKAADREGVEEALPAQEEQPISAGRVRLLDSGHAEELREQVLADQQAALEKVSAPVKEPKTKEAKLAKTVREPKRAAAKAKKEKANGTGGSHTRLDLEATITKLVEGNPKREGSAAHAAFALYRTGMRVATFVQKLVELGQESAAATHLRYDAGKGYIKVG
jgi:hypothetical protein